MLQIICSRELSLELYEDLTKLWNAAGISNPARSDSWAAIKHSLEHTGYLILAYQGDQLCGSAWLTHDYRRLYLQHMAVYPQFQDQGIGRQIMQKSLQIASELGYQAKLEVHHTNNRALHLYREFGFTELEGYLSMIRRQK